MKMLTNIIIFLFIFLVFFVILPIFTFSAFAEGEQIFTVKNNDNITAIISEKELSRIVFAYDKVQRVTSINGEFNYEIAGNNIYLKPVTLKPINFFVETEKGNIYQFLVTCKDVPSVQIFIKNSGHKIDSSSKEISSYNSENILHNELSKIISVATSDDKTLGYSKKKVSLRKKFKDNISLAHDSIWQGDGLIADKYIAENISDKEVTINKDNFMKDDLLGVYLEKEQLNRNERTILILVRRGK